MVKFIIFLIILIDAEISRDKLTADGLKVIAKTRDLLSIGIVFILCGALWATIFTKNTGSEINDLRYWFRIGFMSFGGAVTGLAYDRLTDTMADKAGKLVMAVKAKNLMLFIIFVWIILS